MNASDLQHYLNQHPLLQQLMLTLNEHQCHITITRDQKPYLQATFHWHFVGHSLWPRLQQDLTEHCHQLGYSDCQLSFHHSIEQYQTQQGLAARSGVKNIIAIASGKGGVGKSTVACNLALALQLEGAKVGLLDADIYGPSVPHMLGALSSPESKDSKTLEPILRHGLQVMSIGYLIDSETAMIWRGPMVSTALQQLFNDTQWHDLDYLIIDLPPGTGDIQLTLSQKIPVAGALIVTTPQDIALLDAKRAVAMFNKVQVPVLGIVENMSYHQCEQCGHTDHIFGDGGAELMGQDFHLPLLAKIPLNRQIRTDVDQGEPTVAANPDSTLSQGYRHLAIKMSAYLASATPRLKSRFPKIVME